MNNIEQSVLQMRFDNAQFERGIKQSINSLDNFNKSVDNAIKNNRLTQGLKDIAVAASNLSFKGITEGVDEIQQKFSFLDVFAVNVFSRISNSVLDTANSFGRLITGIDAAREGLDKYGTKMTAIKTIRTATGETEDSVNKTLEDLNWFTDETSYEFDQMVSTMGKFTSAGESLEDSKKEVEGIALWAARSGQNAQIASRVMYQLSQAYGRGYIMAQDWMSVEQANMSTQEIQNKLIEAGGEAAETAIKKTGGFRDSLKSQWLTTKVLNQVLEEYSEGVTQANWNNHEFTGGVTEFSKQAFLAAQEARTLTDVINAVKDVVSTGWMNTFETIFGGQEESTRFFTDLSNNLIDLSYLFIDSRQAAVEAWRAFGGRDQMIEGSNGIFSNLTKAIQLIGSNLIPKKSRDEQLRDLKGLSKEGDELINKIEKFRSGAGIGLGESNKQLAEMYSQLDKLDKAAPLLRITNGIKNFTDGISNAFDQYEKYKNIPNKDSMSDLGLESIMGSDNDVKLAQRMEKLVDIVQGVGHAFSIAKSIVTGFFEAIKPLFTPLEGVADALLDVFSSLGRLVGQTDETTRSGNTFYNLFKGIVDFILPPFTEACNLAAKVLEWLADKIDQVSSSIKDSGLGGFFDGIKSFVSDVGGGISDFFKTIGDVFRSGGGIIGVLKQLGSFAWQGLGKGLGLVGKGLKWLTGDSSVVGSLSKILNLSMAAGGLAGVINLVKGLANLKNITGLIKKGASGKGGIFGSIATVFFGKRDATPSILEPFKQLADSLTGDNGLIDKLKKLADKGKFAAMTQGLKNIGAAFLEIAGSFLLISVALRILSGADPKKLSENSKWLLLSIGEIAGILAVFSGKFKHLEFSGFKAVGFGFAFQEVANAMLVVAIALRILSGADPKKLAINSITLMVSMAAIGGMLAAINITSEKWEFSSLKAIGFGFAFQEVANAMLVVAIALRILSGVDPKKLAINSITLMVSMAAIGGMLAAINITSKKWEFSSLKAIGFGFAFQEVANAMLVVAIALRILSGADPKKLAINSITLMVSMAAIGGMLAAINITSEKWEFSSLKAIGFGFAFQEVANAMLVVAIALRILSGVDPKKLAINSITLMVSMAAIGGMLAVLSLKTEKWEFSSLKAIGFGFAFKEVASAMMMIALSLKMLDGMTPEELLDNAIALISVLGAIAVALGGLSDVISEQDFGGLNVMASGFAMVEVANAMTKIASSLKMLDGMTPEELLDNAIALISALAAIAVALGGLSDVISEQNFGGLNVMASGFAMVEVALACKMIGEALQGVAQYDWNQILVALGGLGLALGELVGVAGIIVATESAGGMAAAAGVLVLLAGSFWLFSLSIQNAADGIATLAGSVGTIVDAVSELASIEEETGQADEMLSALGNAYMNFGTAIMNAGLFAEGKANAIVSLVDSTNQLVDSVQKLVDIPSDEAKAALEALGDGYKSFGNAIKQSGFFGLNASLKGEALSEMADSTLDLANAIKKISEISGYGQGAFDAITDYFTTLNDLDVSASVEKLSLATDSISNFVTNTSGASTGINDIATSLSNLINTISSIDVSNLNSLGSNMATGINNGFKSSSKDILDSVTAMMDSIKTKISDHSSDISDAASSVSIAGADAASGQAYLFDQAGQNFGTGIIIGMQSKKDSIVSTAYALGKAAADAYAEAQDSHSPSKVGIKLGGYFPEGIAIGMKRMGYLVTNAAKDLSTDVVGSIGYNVTTTGYSPTMNYGDGVRYGLDLAHVRSAGYSKPAQEPIIVQATGGQVLGDNAEYTIIVPLEVNGKQFARATATYTRDELHRLDKHNNRMKGIRD